MYERWYSFQERHLGPTSALSGVLFWGLIVAVMLAGTWIKTLSATAADLYWLVLFAGVLLALLVTGWLRLISIWLAMLSLGGLAVVSVMVIAMIPAAIPSLIFGWNPPTMIASLVIFGGGVAYIVSGLIWLNERYHFDRAAGLSVLWARLRHHRGA